MIKTASFIVSSLIITSNAAFAAMPLPSYTHRDFPDTPPIVEKHCKIFDKHMRKKQAEEGPSASVGQLYVYEWGSERYACFSPKDPKKPLTLRNCNEYGLTCP